MKLSDFDYYLPKELIAQKPISPRDHSRLLILDRELGKISHDHFYNLLKYLNKNDVLIFNNTKVFPARLIGRREKTGGKAEVFLLKRINIGRPEPAIPVVIPAQAGILINDQIANGDSRLRGNDSGAKWLRPPAKVNGEYWEVLIGNKKKRVGEKIIFNNKLSCKIIKRLDESVWLIKFNKRGEVLQRLIDKLGQVPLPPYIKNQRSKIKDQKLRNDYQTIYAKYRGSVAAPTAGFHFTKNLLKKIKKAGIQTEFITLHVGFGTFQPVKVKDINKHQMHAEWASLDSRTAKKLNEAKASGKRIIAIGTTTVRTLETFADKNSHLQPQHQWIKTFIYPGYKFKFIDAMITNFHLPKSTLLMLVSAFVGRKKILKSYQEAIKRKYRFYSFGDVMLIK